MTNPHAQDNSTAHQVPQRAKQSWTDGQDDLTTLTLDHALADIPLEDLAGAQVIKTEDRLSIPLIVEYSAITRQTRYRRGEAMVGLAGGRAPPDSSWVEIDPRMSLRKALDLYGQDLLAFEKIDRRISLEIVVLPVRQRRQQTLQVLLRRPAKPT